MRRGSTDDEADDVPAMFDDKPHQLEMSGCLFLLLWVCIALALVALSLFAFVSYLAQSIGS